MYWNCEGYWLQLEQLSVVNSQIIIEDDKVTNPYISIIDAIVLTGIAPSKGQARTLVTQGGITLNDNKISDVSYILNENDFKDGYAILKKGKKIFHKLVK